VEEKKIVNDIKIQIEAKSTLETIKIIDVITIVSALEQKSEQLSAVDQEKIKELHQINSQHKTMLDNLKGVIVKTQDKLQEKKIEYITKVKEDLEKHRRSSRLAKPAYEYLMDKHVHKKPIGKFREWIMGSVGIAIV
jgi:Skp family chaperone for outer membrane proteins